MPTHTFTRKQQDDQGRQESTCSCGFTVGPLRYAALLRMENRHEKRPSLTHAELLTPR